MELKTNKKITKDTSSMTAEIVAKCEAIKELWQAY